MLGAAEIPTGAAEILTGPAEIMTGAAEILSGAADIPTGAADIPTGAVRKTGGQLLCTTMKWSKHVEDQLTGWTVGRFNCFNQF